MSTAALVPAFLAAVSQRDAAVSPAGGEAALVAYVEAAAAPWPELGLNVLEFVGHVAARSQGGKLPPIAHAAELWLACACARGVPAAIAAFQRDYGPVIARVLARRKASADVADDVQQLLAERLLVPDTGTGRPAKIADYKGQGPLKSWVATAAATTLLSLRRAAGRRREAPEQPADIAWAGVGDAELEFLKQRYAPAVEAAVVEALETLGDRDRTLLRLHLEERLSIDVLGAMYGVNRATAARWLAAARQAILHGARERLRAQLALSGSECDSLVALAQSRLDISILRHLAPPEARP